MLVPYCIPGNLSWLLLRATASIFKGKKTSCWGKKIRAITFFLHILCIYSCLFLLIFHLSYVAWSRISSIYNNGKKYWKIVDPFQGPLTKHYDACWWKVLTASHNSALERDSIISGGSIAQSSPSVLRRAHEGCRALTLAWSLQGAGFHTWSSCADFLVVSGQCLCR